MAPAKLIPGNCRSLPNKWVLSDSSRAPGPKLKDGANHINDWNNRKPMLVLFRKYIAQFDKPISEIESTLEKPRFNNTGGRVYTSGKDYGQVSVKSIKLSAEIDGGRKEIKLFASFFGALFDTGDVWQVTSDDVNG